MKRTSRRYFLKRSGAASLAFSLPFISKGEVLAQMNVGNSLGDGFLPCGMVTFTIDDGNRSLYDHILPTLYPYRFPATAYIITGRIGDQDCISEDQLWNLYWLYGWEIANHTVSHPDLTQLAWEQMKDEILGAQTALHIRGILNIQSFTAPGGKLDSKAIDLVQSAGFTSIRYPWDETDKFNTVENFNPWVVNSYSFRNTVPNPRTFNDIKPLIDEAYALKKWLNIVLHECWPGEPTGEYQLPLSELQKTVQYTYKLVRGKRLVVPTLTAAVSIMLRCLYLRTQ